MVSHVTQHAFYLRLAGPNAAPSFFRLINPLRLEYKDGAACLRVALAANLSIVLDAKAQGPA